MEESRYGPAQRKGSSRRGPPLPYRRGPPHFSPHRSLAHPAPPETPRPSAMDPTTRFGEDEIKRILARAAERQLQADRLLPVAPSNDSSSTDITLADLQEAAKEAGISPAHVLAAARETRLRRDTPEARESWLGIPRQIVDYRLASGPLSEEQWEQVVGEIRSEFRVQGVANSFGDTREWWSSSTAADPIVFRLQSDEQGATMSIRRGNRSAIELTGVLGGTFGALGVLAAGISLVGGTLPLVIPAVVGGLTAGIFGAGILLARRGSDTLEKRFKGLLDRIDLIARRDGPA